MAQENVFSDLIPAKGGAPDAQPQAGGFRPLGPEPAPKPEGRMMTPEEVRAFGGDPSLSYWMNADGKPELIAGQTKNNATKPTGEQQTAALFYGRAARAMGAWDKIDPGSRDPRTIPGQWFHDTFPSIDNTLNSDARSAADALARDFITATLRKESGAAIGQNEFDNQYRIFFPMPGDGPETLRQKALARQQAMEGLRVAAGPAGIDLKIVQDGTSPQSNQAGGAAIPATLSPVPNNPNDPAGRYPGGIQFNDQAQEQVQSYRFTPDQENAMRTVLMDPNATPDDYAQMVTSFAAKQGVNVDQVYYQSALAEGQRIRAQLAKGGQLGQGVNYKGADETARARAEAEAQRVNAVTGQPGLGDLANQGVTWGLSDEAAGAGKAVGSLLQGDTNIADNYALGRDAERIRLEQARANTGGTGTAVELGSGLLMGGSGVMANPIKAATVGGAVSGYGYGEGTGGSAVSAAGGALVGNLGGRLAERLMSGGAVKAPSDKAVRVARAENLGIDLPMDAAGGRGARIIGNTLDNMPGSAQVMQAGRDKLSGQVSQAVDNVAAIAGDAQGNRGLGVAAQDAARGGMTRGEQKMSALYDEIQISPGTMTSMPNTLSKLEELTTKFSSNPDFGKNRIDQSLVRDLDALRAKVSSETTGLLDANGNPITRTVETPGGLSFDDLKAFRTDVGEYIGEAIIGEGRSRKDLRSLYASLSQDMEEAARSVSPKALAQFRRANDYAQRHFDRVEGAFAQIVGKDMDANPEKAANKLRAMLTDGNASADLNTVAKLRGASSPDEWGQVQSGLIRMMGQPLKTEGRDFNPQTFIDTYGRMTPKAKNIVFGSKGSLREALDEFTAVSGDLAARNALRNTSNTAGQVMTGAAFFSVGNLPALLGQMASSYGVAKLFNSPRFVRWATGYNRMLAGAAKAGGQPNVQKQMALLSKVATAEPAIASDILGLQRALSQAFEGAAAQAPMKAAAEDQQPQPPR